MPRNSALPRRHHSPAASLCLLALVAGACGSNGGRPAGSAGSDLRASAVSPRSFEDTLVAAVPQPTALTFTPDGRMLVASRPGQLLMYAGGRALGTALDLSGRLCTNSERGLLGVAVDPAFEANRAVYVFYTYNKNGGCEQGTPRAPVNRVSRFVLGGNGRADPGSERVLLDNIPSPHGNHNAGDLHFGRDGLLYVSVGDGGGPGPNVGAAARDEHTLLGKILRVTRDGDIPAGNPFQGSDSARCNVTGGTEPGKRCRETFAWGLRNPFRLAFDPNASGTRFFINDVGWNNWEEIDLGQGGADYGWNVREGFCARGSATDCGAPPRGMVNPVYAYPHGKNPAPSPFQGCNSITGGAFVPNGVWPAEYDHNYLFSDYVCGKIFRLIPQAGGGYTVREFVTGLGESSAVHLTFGPHGAGQALYYTSYAGGGEVRRLAYTAGGNRAPVAEVTARPTSGGVPLAVSFDAAGSRDPDGDALSYTWDFGDGSPSASGPSVRHTYTGAGSFLATLTARDPRGATGRATVRIDAGNTPPSPTIQSPAEGELFRVGQTVTLRGRATDAEDGTLPPSALRWTVLLHHDAHTHPLFGPRAGDGLTFTAPAPEDLLAAGNSYLSVTLTATDARGLSRSVTRRYDPRKVRLTLASEPAGLRLGVNGTRVTTPATLITWAGQRLSLDAPAQSSAGGPASFVAWSSGEAAGHDLLVPGADATYTARYWVGAGPAVVGFTLVDADTGSAIPGLGHLGSGLTLNLAALPTRRVNLRADVGPARVGSVRFGEDGNPSLKVENGAPYALGPNSSSGYGVWTPGTRTHTVTATPFVGAGGSGAAGRARTLRFNVVNAATGAGSGLRGEYYARPDFTGTRVTRDDPTVDFDWGMGSPVGGIGADGFSIRWTGQIEPAFSETYTLYTTSDDGVRLWVSGQKVIDNWTRHGATLNAGTIRLTAGQRYPVVLELYDDVDRATARLEWESASQPRQVVPQARLYLP